MADEFIDSSIGHSEDHTPSISGATIDTNIYKYGDGSGNLGNTQQVHYPVSNDFNIGSSSLTISFWVYKPVGSFKFTCAYQTNAVSYPVSLQINMTESSIFLRAVALPSTIRIYIRSTTINITDTGWHHVEIGRDSSSGYIFIDGINQTLDRNTYNGVMPEVTGASAGLEIGYDFGIGGYSSCYIDDFKIDKDVCRHTSDFTPPESEDIDNDEYTVLYLKCNASYGSTYEISADDSLSLQDSNNKAIYIDVKDDSYVDYYWDPDYNSWVV